MCNTHDPFSCERAVNPNSVSLFLLKHTFSLFLLPKHTHTASRLSLIASTFVFWANSYRQENLVHVDSPPLSLSSNSSNLRLNFSSQTHRAQPHASLSSPPPLFSEKLRPTRCCDVKSTAATCSSRRSHRTTGQPLPPHRSLRTAVAADLVMLHFPTS